MKIPELPSKLPSSIDPSFGKIGLAIGSVALGQWLLNDVAHVPGGGFAFLALGAGMWWLNKPNKTTFDSPTSVEGWVVRCKKVIEQFLVLEEQDNTLIRKENRLNELANILDREKTQTLAFIGSSAIESLNKSAFEACFDQIKPLDVVWEPSLPNHAKSRFWPECLDKRDLLVYSLPLPLRASDLLWLSEIPEQQPSWILVEWTNDETWNNQLNEVYSQLPDRWQSRVLRIRGNDQKEVSLVFSPIKKVLSKSEKNIDQTTQRLLSRLHSSWQGELEKIRRRKFSDLQQRNQWVVAGAVFASPVPSTDLLSLAVINGLMIKDMASIWSCHWRPEVLQIVVRQLVGAAIAQGIVEWSGQALLSISKLHSGSWLAAGIMQSLSAAYLTRVVGRSMADWMALNNGVEECDLEALKLQAPQIVAKAAAEEKVDWSSFLKQASLWSKEMRSKVNNAGIISA